MLSNNTILMLAALLMGCVLLVGSQTQAATFAWTNNEGDGNWSDAGNWVEYDSGTETWNPATSVPGQGWDNAIVNKGGLDFTDNDDLSNHDSGLDDFNAHEPDDYSAPSGKGDATFNLKSGDFDSEISRAWGSDGNTDTINQSGGSWNIPWENHLNLTMTDNNSNSKGIYNISGGSIDMWNYEGPNGGGGGSGSAEFKVSGSDPTIEVSSAWKNGDTTLKFRIGQNGVSPIEAEKNGASFSSGATLDMGFMDGVSASKDDTFTLMTWGDVATGVSNLSLAAEDTDAWEMNYDESSGGSLTATYLVPEPSSLALLGLAGLLLMKRPRRRA